MDSPPGRGHKLWTGVDNKKLLPTSCPQLAPTLTTTIKYINFPTINASAAEPSPPKYSRLLSKTGRAVYVRGRLESEDRCRRRGSEDGPSGPPPPQRGERRRRRATIPRHVWVFSLRRACPPIPCAHPLGGAVSFYGFVVFMFLCDRKRASFFDSIPASPTE